MEQEKLKVAEEFLKGLTAAFNQLPKASPMAQEDLKVEIDYYYECLGSALYNLSKT